MFMIRYSGLMVVAISALTACAWVELTPGGESVRIAGAGEVSECSRVGEVTARVLDKAAFMKRSRDKQATELATLARNEAAEMGADTIVAMRDIQDGRRRFTVYRCN